MRGHRHNSLNESAGGSVATNNNKQKDSIEIVFQEGEFFEEPLVLEETDINQRPPCRQTNIGFHLEEAP